MIKIVDDTISDINKDEAEKNENEKYKITETPLDDTIEEKDKELHRQLLKLVAETMDRLQDDTNIITAATEHMHQ